MYKNLCFFGKLVSFILLVVAMVLIRDYDIFLLISGMILILSFLNNKRFFFIISFILFLLIFFVPFNENIFLMFRILLVVLYGMIIYSSLLSMEKRYLYDKLFYRTSSSKKIRQYIKKYYYSDLVDKYDEDNMRVLKYTDDSKYLKFLKNQSEKKANADIDDIYLLDRLRFDRFYDRKKSRLTFSWNNYDNVYLGISLLLFMIVLVFGV